MLADGRQTPYRIGWVQVRIDGRSQPTIAGFGDPGAEPLLGVFTLEGFRLAADPVNRRLVPVPALLKSMGVPRGLPARGAHERGRFYRIPLSHGQGPCLSTHAPDLTSRIGLA